MSKSFDIATKVTIAFSSYYAVADTGGGRFGHLCHCLFTAMQN